MYFIFLTSAVLVAEFVGAKSLMQTSGTSKETLRNKSTVYRYRNTEKQSRETEY